MNLEIEYYNSKKSKYILYLTPFCLCTSLLNLYRHHYILFSIEFFVFSTSVFHWYNPYYGWKRNLDICGVLVGIITHLYFIYISMCYTSFYCNIITLTSLSLSLIKSSYMFHCIGWICACLGNIYLSNCITYYYKSRYQ